MSKRRSQGSNSSYGLAKKRPNGTRFRIGPALKQLIKNSPDIATDFINSWHLVKLLIVLELIINYLVINYVKYTDIDWSTYMIQVGKVFNSKNYNFNYTEIEGPTGPLVYPAGHLYIYYLLSELTDHGTNIKSAQYIFACIYVAQLILVYKLYSHKRTLKVPPYLFIILCLTSYRIHSIYILRLFNDPIAILIANASFFAFLKRKYCLSAILFSLAISIKMNVILFAPAYGLIFFEEVGFYRSLKYGLVSLATQISLALPFLLKNPTGYLERAFDFGRVFLHKWTVNWRFLPETTFTSPPFFIVLLIIHLLAMFLIYAPRWLNILRNKKYSQRRDDPILTLSIINFIGVACSRSLHYQFYVWYYHSLPLILWATRYNMGIKLLLLGCIEFAWNQYPSTNFSSLLLQACHILIFVGLLASKYMKPSTRK